MLLILSVKASAQVSPSAPSDLNALFINPEMIDLSWNDNSNNETGFTLEQSADKQFSVNQSYSLNENITRFLVKGLHPNTEYFFRIKSVNKSGNSVYSKALTVKTADEDNFPLALSKGRLMTKKGQPFLINGDTPWSLIVGPDRKGVEQYLEDRRLKGVDAVMVNLIEHYFNGPDDAYGYLPFADSLDFSKPNEHYFENADYVIGKAREKGMAVFLFPAYLGAKSSQVIHKEGWYAEVNANGSAKMYEYGRFVGRRYKDFKNIVWMMGGDCAPEDAIDGVREMVRGMKETAGNQLFSVHNARFHSGVTEYPTDHWIDLNTTYANCSATPENLLSDYNRKMPFFYVEGKYENEGASPVCLRSQFYWPVLMGSCGYFFGVTPVWGFDKDWQNYLDSQGSQDLKRAGEFFNSRRWHDLIPDNDHKTLISGYGNISDASYAAAGRMSNGSTVIVYTPDQRNLTIEMTRISGNQSHGWWYQPSSGKTIDLGLFPNKGSHLFNPPAEGDWLLVLDDARLSLKKPGIPVR